MSSGRQCIESTFAAIVCTIFVLATLSVAGAQVRTSPNYQLQSDSINTGGGLSSSTNFRQESTVGEIATGQSTSTNYSLRAGYQQLQEVYISISDAADVIMSPDLPGLTGGESNGSTTVTVTTDSPAGYQLTIQSENTPAMQSPTDSIANYPAAGTPDYNFTVGSGQAYFGFSAISLDVISDFKDNGVDTCGGASTQNNVGVCWKGLSTSPIAVAGATGPNHPLGTETNVYFKVGIGSGAGVAPGVYTATTTMTALAL